MTLSLAQNFRRKLKEFNKRPPMQESCAESRGSIILWLIGAEGGYVMVLLLFS